MKGGSRHTNKCALTLSYYLWPLPKAGFNSSATPCLDEFSASRMCYLIKHSHTVQVSLNGEEYDSSTILNTTWSLQKEKKGAGIMEVLILFVDTTI